MTPDLPVDMPDPGVSGERGDGRPIQGDHWTYQEEWCMVCHQAQPCEGIRQEFALLQGQIAAVVRLCHDLSGHSARTLARDICELLDVDDFDFPATTPPDTA